MKSLMMGVAAVALLGACTPKTATPDTTTAAAPIEPNADGKYVNAEGLELSAADYWGNAGIDLTVRNEVEKPGDNFYAYANGKWLDSFVIPADKSRYGSFDFLAEKSEQRVLNIINDLAAAKPAADTSDGKIAAYYNAYMNTDKIEADGLAPAQPYLDRIKSISSLDDLATVFGTVGYTSPIGGFAFSDDKDPETVIFQMNIAGLGLPDRDYYLKDDEKSVETRAK